MMRSREQQARQHQPDPGPLEPRGQLLLHIPAIEQLLRSGLDQQCRQRQRQKRQPRGQGPHLGIAQKLQIRRHEFDDQDQRPKDQRHLQKLPPCHIRRTDQADEAPPVQAVADQQHRQGQRDETGKLDRKPARRGAAHHLLGGGQRHNRQKRLHQIDRRQIERLDNQNPDQQQARVRRRTCGGDEPRMGRIGRARHQRRIASRAASQPTRIMVASIIR